MTLIRVAAGAAQGSDHRALGRNLQDAAGAWTDGATAYGLVSDGCGSGRRSEVGAQLTVAAGLSALARADVALAEVPGWVVAEVVRALGEVLRAVAPRDPQAFVEECLSATLLGFLAREEGVVVFGVGDGTLWVGADTWALDRGGRPEVPAHALFGGRVSRFERVAPAPARPATRQQSPWLVGVATDGVPASFRTSLPSCRGDLSRHLVLLGRRGSLADDGAVACAIREAP